MSRSFLIGLLATVAGGLAACTSDYSPNTYSSAAVQQANKVEPGVVVGYRQISISANGTVGAVTGGAAGGILGAQVGPGGFNSALGTVGGSAIGTILGTSLEHIAGDTTGWEYIVRKPNGELLSLSQREPQPIPIGQKVLVITGSQARIIPDLQSLGDGTAPAEKPADKPSDKPAADKPTAGKTASPSVTTKLPVEQTPMAAPQTDAPQAEAKHEEPKVIPPVDPLVTAPAAATTASTAASTAASPVDGPVRLAPLPTTADTAKTVQ
ncbi:glycine zipper 2TM domain-containing protein [Azospirillum griseum]|uniref:glycine zipper 2TM domain-containing protein n=1 Tax=Azospirillum griseum TaxID=2496639 RepID=UPI001FEC395B|nr:glycine zipper 2TM domain-containing protein [Azospirillum griseum]